MLILKLNGLIYWNLTIFIHLVIIGFGSEQLEFFNRDEKLRLPQFSVSQPTTGGLREAPPAVSAAGFGPSGCWALTLWNWVEQYQCLVFIFQRYFNIFQIIYYFIKLIIMFTYKVLFSHLEWVKSLLEIQSIGDGIGDVKLFQFKPQSLCWLLCVGFFPDISLRALSLTQDNWAMSPFNYSRLFLRILIHSHLDSS